MEDDFSNEKNGDFDPEFTSGLKPFLHADLIHDSEFETFSKNKVSNIMNYKDVISD